MKENWGKGKILKAMMAGCLLFNNFSGLGSIINAAAIEQNEINSLLDGNVNGGDSVLDSDTSVDNSNGGNDSEEMTPILPGDGTIEGDSNDSQKPEDEQSEIPEVEVPSEDEQPEIPEVEVPSEDEQPEVPEVEVPSDEEADLDFNTSEDNQEMEESSDVDEEEVALEDESELFSLENRSVGSGLVQLWQVIVPGQENLEKWPAKDKNGNKIEYDDQKSKLYGKIVHDLDPVYDNQASTYVNSDNVDDALYLKEDASFYYIYLSGYEGKVRKSETKTVTMDLNQDGTNATYKVNAVAYYIPAGVTTYSLKETTEPLDVPELNYYDQTLDKYNDINEKSIELYANSTVQSPSYYANENGTLIHYITSNVTRTDSYSKVIAGKAPSWMSQGVKYFSYDGIYFYNNWRNIRVNGQGAVNQNNPFYNYYQYLPFRSKSNYSASTFDTYTNLSKESGGAGGAGGKLVNTGQYFYAVQDKYGINGALQYVMGIHESGSGKSSLSIDKNNLFGMNATDNNPYGNGTSFPSVEAGINYHADRYLSWGYTDPIDDWRYFGSHVGNKGSGMNVKYASDPFWGEKIAGWYYRFDKASGLKDHDYYTIGIKQSNDVYNIRSQATTSSSVLYQTKNKKSNLKISNYPVLITGEQNGFYKIKTDTPIVNGQAQFNAQYNWDSTNGYISKDNISSLNNTYYRNPDNSGDVQYIGSMMDMYWSGDRLIIQGYGELSKYPVPWWNSVTHRIILVNQATKQEYSYDMNPEKSTWLAGDPHGLGGDYSYAQYSGNLNLNSLPVGKYDIYHETTVSGYIHREKLYNNNQLALPSAKQIRENSYILSQYNDGTNKPVVLEKVDNSTGVNYTGRMSDMYWSGDRLIIQGYGELAGYPVPWWNSVTHRIVLVNQATKQEYSYDMNPEKSTWLAGDPHGLGGDYSYAQYSGNLNLNSLPVGKYDIYHETTVSGYTHREKLYNNAQLALPNQKNLGGSSYKLSQYNDGTNKPVVLEKVDNSTGVNYTGRMSDMYWSGDRLIIQGYGELAGYPVPWWSSVTHRIVLVNQATKQEYSYDMNPEKSTWLAGDPHGLGGDYSYAQYSGNLNLNSLPVGKYDIYHETTVSGYTHREKLYNNAQLSLPNQKNLGGSSYKLSQYNDGTNKPVVLEKVDNSTGVNYTGRMSDMYWSGDRLIIQGYGELAGYPVPWWSSVTHRIVLVNQATKQEYSYDMNPEKSTWLAGDPHGLGGDYSYAQYSGNLNLNSLPVGKYDIYHETTVSGYTHREKLYNNAQLALPNEKDLWGSFYKLSQYNDGTNNPVVLEKK